MSKPSKKLSLEERLSLAARKNKKKTKKSSPSPAAISITSEVSGDSGEKIEPKEEEESKKFEESDETKNGIYAEESNPSTPETDLVTLKSTENISATDKSPNDCQQGQSEHLNSLINTAPWSFWLPKVAKVSTIDEFLNILKPVVQSIYDEREELSKKLVASKQREESGESIRNREKDELISQLRSEGEKLAGTELRQNNIIKALKKKVSGIESGMDTLKAELSKNIRAFEQVSNSNEELQILVRNHESHIDELRQEKARLKDVESHLCEKEGEEQRLRGNLATIRTDAELKEKALHLEIKSLKSASQEQVTRLEATLEHLRIELDCQFKKASHNTTRRSKEDLLRNELESYKSSWSQLENTFNGKISDMDTKILDLQQSRSQLNEQLKSSKFLIKSLESQLLEEQEEKRENAARLQELQQESEQSQKQLQDTNEDYKLLQKKFELQRLQLELNIGSPKKKEELVRSVNTPIIRKEVMTSAEIDEDWLSPPNLSQVSPMESSVGFENSSLRKEVDELSDTQPIQDEDDKLSTNELDIPDEAAALGASTQEVSLTPGNTNSINYQRRSTQVDVTGQMNTHMLSKLGAEVRRYEAELVSLQNTCDRLQKEKNEASNEILKLLEENEEVQNLMKEKEALCQKLEEVQNRLNVALQLLGEKTERIEELENDVMDLKEMMRQQFQQIVEMQERIS